MNQAIQKALLHRPNLTVTAGFDGYIDTVSKVRRGDGQARYFRTIGEFGAYITGKSGLSGSLELEKITTKMGGNMPIFARALSSLDVSVRCVGALGYPVTSEMFSELKERCELYNICNPGRCDALEFEDGKLMLAENLDIDHFDYELLTNRITADKLVSLYNSSDLIALLNWSEMKQSISIWNGILREIVPHISQSRTMLIDFSDCSGRPAEDIREVADMVCRFAEHFRVYVSLNRNEAVQMTTKLGCQKETSEDIARVLQDRFRCDMAVIHLSDGCAYADNKNCAFLSNKVIKKPVIQTGGGDNFNAGLAFGLLSGLVREDALQLANAVSGYYVANGVSPGREDLLVWTDNCGYFKNI